jgi:hypothetical protein
LNDDFNKRMAKDILAGLKKRGYDTPFAAPSDILKTVIHEATVKNWPPAPEPERGAK